MCVCVCVCVRVLVFWAQLTTADYISASLVERTNKAEIRWEEQSEKAENRWKGLLNEIQLKGP